MTAPLSRLWLPQAAAVPSPCELAAYLLQQRWTLQRADARWAVYSKTLDNEVIEFEVPQLESSLDYARAVRFLLEDVARLEQRPAVGVLDDVQRLTGRAPDRAEDLRPQAEPDES